MDLMKRVSYLCFILLHIFSGGSCKNKNKSLASNITVINPVVKPTEQGTHEDSDNQTKLHWVLLHYHKTGHDLSVYFGSDIFKNYTCSKLTERFRIIEHSDHSLNDFRLNDIVVMHTGNYDWNAIFHAKDHFYKVVHFVRDPFDIILSGPFCFHFL